MPHSNPLYRRLCRMSKHMSIMHLRRVSRRGRGHGRLDAGRCAFHTGLHIGLVAGHTCTGGHMREYVHMSVHMSVQMSIHMSVHMSIYMSIHIGALSSLTQACRGET